MATHNITYEQRLKVVRRLDTGNSVASHYEAAAKLVADYPDRPGGWFNFAIALTDMARYEEARKAYDKCARLCDPDMRDRPYFWKGDLYEKQGKLPLAENWYRRSLKVNSKNADCWGFLGSILARRGCYGEAKDAWRKVIRLSTGATDEAHLNLGLILRAERRYKEALKHAEKAIELDPKYKEAKLLKKDLLKVLGEKI